MDEHDIYMRRCLQLALLGSGHVAPNPMVGAVLVHENKVLGEGYHMKYGEAHAEVNCINSVAPHHHHLIPDSTLYVSLEPCTHFGKTPPCTDLIIKHGIKNVVIGSTDPNERVNGSGITKLTAAGTRVSTGVLLAEAEQINKRFFTFHKKLRPYIILKWAQSNDHKVAGENSARTQITNPQTNILVHKWRSEEGAIMIGTTTALKDDPSLTTRLWPGNHPLRIIIDKHLLLPGSAVVMKDEHPAIIINTIRHEEKGNKLFYKAGESENILTVAMNLMYQRNIISVIVEGGPVLLRSFIDTGLWDEARVITNTEMYIDAGLPAPILDAQLSETINIGSDQVQFFTNDNKVK